MSTFKFLKPIAELDFNVDEMPANENTKKKLGVWICQINGPIPGEGLQLGMAILRGLDMSRIADDESPPFWAFVGFLEWINAALPAPNDISDILHDLRVMYPMSTQALVFLLEKIGNKHLNLVFASRRLRL